MVAGPDAQASTAAAGSSRTLVLVPKMAGLGLGGGVGSVGGSLWLKGRPGRRGLVDGVAAAARPARPPIAPAGPALGPGVRARHRPGACPGRPRAPGAGRQLPG